MNKIYLNFDLIEKLDKRIIKKFNIKVCNVEDLGNVFNYKLLMNEYKVYKFLDYIKYGLCEIKYKGIIFGKREFDIIN
jgi:hypothetical protein